MRHFFFIIFQPLWNFVLLLSISAHKENSRVIFFNRLQFSLSFDDRVMSICICVWQFSKVLLGTLFMSGSIYSAQRTAKTIGANWMIKCIKKSLWHRSARSLSTSIKTTKSSANRFWQASALWTLQNPFFGGLWSSYWYRICTQQRIEIKPKNTLFLWVVLDLNEREFSRL